MEDKELNDYWPKIKYWNGLLRTAIRNNDITGAVLCSSQLEYYTKKQKDIGLPKGTFTVGYNSRIYK
tara:strand:+ start:2885 stop:3085 length:201 start_codon:yes stop_codon:yes gene_type:complete